MKKLKAFVLCALLTPYTVFASVNGINNDNNGYDINGNTCMMNTGNADINEALAAQNPACHMGNKTFNLNSNAVGLRGPLSVSTQYSDEFGVVVNAKLTQSLSADNAISFELDYGENENRFGMTWAHFLNSQNRVKLTVERLQQKLDFNFDSGEVSKRVPQYAVGGVYQYLIEEGMVTHLELGAYYAKAESEELDTKNYMSGGSEYINYRHIAGAKSKGIDFSIGLLPWETGNVKITMNYDQVRYNQKYDKIDADDTQGFGAGVTLSQLLNDRLKLNLSASAREVYNLYEAKLLWLVPTTKDSQLELGLNVSRNEGHGTRTDNRFGLTASYLWDGNYGDSGYSMPGSVKMGSLVSWAANPAVHMAQVLATADQRSELVPLPAALPPMYFMRMLANTTVDVSIMAGDPASINIMNYVPVSDPALVSVSSDNLPDSYHLAYDDATGLLSGTPSSSAVNTSTILPVEADVQALDPENPVYNVNLNIAVNDMTTSPVPWANQGFRYNKIVVKSYTDPSDAKVTDFTFDRGDKYGTAINSDDMFVYPITGFSDYSIQSSFPDFPGEVTCDGCEVKGRGDITLHFKAPQDYAQDEPYLVRIYPTNHNYNQYGPGAPQIIKVKVDFADPLIVWQPNAITVTPINTTKIEATWAEDAAVEKTEPSTPITYTAVLDQALDGATCASTNTSISCEGLKPSTDYSVTVTASDVLSDGRMAEPVSQTSDDVTTYTGVVWADPRNVNARPVDNSTTSAMVTWSNTATTEDGWTLQYIVSYFERDAGDSYHQVAVLPSTATSQIVSGLKPGVEYRFKVEAVDDHDSLPVSGKINATTNAGFSWGANVSADVVDGKTDQVNLTWDAATSDVGVVHYTVTYRVSDEEPVTLPAVDSPALGQPVNDLPQDADVTFTVTASVDDQDGETVQIVSEPVSVHTNYSLRWSWEEPMAAAPVTDSLDSVVVSWEESAESTVSDSVHYVLYYTISGEEQPAVELTNNPYTITGLTQNTAVTNVHVNAVDDVSSPVSSNVVDTKVNAQLVWASSASVVATAKENSTNQVLITWGDDATTEVGVDSLGYVLHYTVDGVEQPGVPVASGSYPLTLNDGVNSVTDLYIEALDTISPNVKSNVIDLVETHTGMTWAADVTAVVVDGKTDQVDLSWSDADSDVGDVRYTVDYTVGGEPQEPIVINAPEHSVPVTGLAQDAEVSFSVTATVDNQDGAPYHVIAEAVLVHTNYALRWPALESDPVTATSVDGSSTSIHLEWGGAAESSFNPVSYVLTYTVGEDEKTVPDFDGAATSFNITGLTEGSTVRNIVITAHDAATDAVSPDVSSVPVSQTANQPLDWSGDVLASVVATTNTIGSLDVTWLSATSEVGPVTYKIYASRDGVDFDAGTDATAPNSTTLPGLDLGTLYYVKVEASDGVSTITSEPLVSATTYHGVVWTNPSVTATAVDNTSDSVDVSWSGDEFKNDLGTMQFRVEYQDDVSGYQQFGELLDSSSRATRVTGLHSNTHYTVRVTMVNGVQAENALPSANDDATTNAGLTWTGSVSATALSAKQVELQWAPANIQTDFNDGNIVFTYRLNGGAIETVPASQDPESTGTILLDELDENSDYSIELWATDEVHAADDHVSAPGVPLSVKTMKGIELGDLTYTADKHDASVTLSGSTGTNTPLLYTVVVSYKHGNDIETKTVEDAQNNQSYTVAFSNLEKSTDYKITVTATDGADSSAKSSSVGFQTLKGVSISDLLVSAKTSTSLQATWNGNNDVSTTSSTLTLSLLDENDHEIYSDSAYHLQGYQSKNFSGEIGDLVVGHQYYVQVSAVNADDLDDVVTLKVPYTAQSAKLYCPDYVELPISDGNLDTTQILTSGGYDFAFKSGTSTGLHPANLQFVDARLSNNQLFCEYSDKAPDVPDFNYATVKDLGDSATLMDANGTAAGIYCASSSAGSVSDCYVQL